MTQRARLTTRVEREAFRSAKRACYAGLDSVALRTELAQRVASAVPMEAYSFATTDPDTGLVTHSVGEGLSINLARAYLERIYPEETAIFGIDHARAGCAVVSMVPLSPALREVLEGEGFRPEINLLCASAGDLWGSWCMIREVSSPEFSERERAFSGLIAPHIGRGLRTAALLDATPGENSASQPGELNGDDPGVLILDAHGRTERRTAAAAAHLADLADVGMETNDMPFAVASILLQLHSRHAQRAAGSEVTAGDAELRARGRSGRWYKLRGCLAEPNAVGNSSTVVLIEPLAPREMAPLLARLYGLSPREREVVVRVARGDSTKRIAARLGLSIYTVQEHLDKASDKVGVRGRRALVAKLWFDGYTSGRL